MESLNVRPCPDWVFWLNRLKKKIKKNYLLKNKNEKKNSKDEAMKNTQKETKKHQITNKEQKYTARFPLNSARYYILNATALNVR